MTQEEAKVIYDVLMRRVGSPDAQYIIREIEEKMKEKENGDIRSSVSVLRGSRPFRSSGNV